MFYWSLFCLVTKPHPAGKIHFDDISLDNDYRPEKSYRQSKLANVLFARELAARLQGTTQIKTHAFCCFSVFLSVLTLVWCIMVTFLTSSLDTGVTVYSLHPGVIRTELGRHLFQTWALWKRVLFSLLLFLIKNPWEGAQTTIYCAVDESIANQSGLYYRQAITDCKQELYPLDFKILFFLKWSKKKNWIIFRFSPLFQAVCFISRTTFNFSPVYLLSFYLV